MRLPNPTYSRAMFAARCIAIGFALAASPSPAEELAQPAEERVRQLEEENRQLRHELSILRLRELGASAGGRGDGSPHVHVSFPHERYGKDSGGERWYGFAAPLKLIGGLDGPVSLDLLGSYVTDRELVLLRDVDQVVGLELAFTHVTDASMEAVGTLTSLKHLGLRHCRITDEGLRHMAGLKSLRALSLQSDGTESSVRVTDAGMEHLAGLTELRSLNLIGNPLGDDGLAQLKGLTELRVLELSMTNVTDAGLRHLRDMKQLRDLKLWHVRGVTDLGLRELENLPRLERVNAIQTRATRAGVARLTASVPGLEVRLTDADRQFNWKRAADDMVEAADGETGDDAPSEAERKRGGPAQDPPR